jgi:hypothetical protein
MVDVVYTLGDIFGLAISTTLNNGQKFTEYESRT